MHYRIYLQYHLMREKRCCFLWYSWSLRGGGGGGARAPQARPLGPALEE